MKSESNGKINIAIDGPAGAGKSTIARMVASALSYIYVDTGAMYRAVTWYMIQHGIEPDEEQEVLQTAQNLVIQLIPGVDGQKVLVNEENVTTLIRSLAVNAKVSRYAQIEGLRTQLVSLQRQMALRKGVVMDGRDIGTTVLPDAEVKIFMTATVQERARRRYMELKDSVSITLEQLEHDIAARDHLDEQREISPLRQADDAIWMDTTEMNTLEVTEAIVSLAQRSGWREESK
ncbi:cytidylate kinase [Paenibacillus shirakamiensis]|uniref:Cytidylate kinase n=1 Tax=Paenibacillus shirakamiensis TaxID=1265935 RepID=A0ABS4JCS4_9BACL|nr:(d)CMP kinase [Paenibacillus shirakamiensis]MBP1999519.1 cytidylate kinase [Paenibacillus shirakamiensis]